jgi:hypothetical protein
MKLESDMPTKEIEPKEKVKAPKTNAKAEKEKPIELTLWETANKLRGGVDTAE